MPRTHIFYLLAIISLLLGGCVDVDTSTPSSSPTTAEIIINNKTEYAITQLYIKKSGTQSYNDDMIPDLDSISARSKSSFETSMCGEFMDIKVTSRFGTPKWNFDDELVPCNQTTTFTITY